MNDAIINIFSGNIEVANIEIHSHDAGLFLRLCEYIRKFEDKERERRWVMR